MPKYFARISANENRGGVGRIRGADLKHPDAGDIATPRGGTWGTDAGQEHSRSIEQLSSVNGPRALHQRWEHEHIIEAAQARLDQNPQAMRVRRETVEHPFGTLKMRMGATHFLMKTLPKVATEMALHVLAYNLTRVMNIVDIKLLLAAIRA